jgi:adenylosuccinate synthase
VLKTNQLPLAGILSGATLGVGSGVAVDPVMVEDEIERFAEYGVGKRVKIDSRCPVILPEYMKEEAENAHLNTTVGSTLSGTGIAQSRFCLRTVQQAGDIESLAPYTCDVSREINEACRKGETVIIEGSQGAHLSLALTHDYPYCTSGNCTTVACADDVGLNWQYITDVILVVKAVPSRVGEGPLPFEISEREQDTRGIAEYGVRTGRRRRKSERIPMDLLKEAIMWNGPTRIALTFCDHYDPEVADGTRLTDRVKELVDMVEKETNVPVSLVDTGRLYRSIIEIS